jgi:hypothetical protein
MPFDTEDRPPSGGYAALGKPAFITFHSGRDRRRVVRSRYDEHK